MVNAIAASLALFGASVSALGSAKVVNECPYEVYLCATPAGGNGLSPVDKTLQPGDDWEDQYTSLGNGAGWSIKLSKDEDAFSSNILQYECAYIEVWKSQGALRNFPLPKSEAYADIHPIRYLPKR